jgi:hypothetical protein
MYGGETLKDLETIQTRTNYEPRLDIYVCG